MTPDRLRTLSLRTFKATVYCAIAGIMVLIAVPNPGSGAAATSAARIVAQCAFGLLGIAFFANLVSLVTGAIAWAKGAPRCPWIFVSALVILVPFAIWIAASLNL